MTLYTLVKNCKWEDIRPIILAICRDRGPDEYVNRRRKNKKGYDCFEDAFNRLKCTQPVASDTVIQISLREKEPEDEHECTDNKTYIDVCCYKKDYEGRCGFCYPWDESLGMEIIFKDGLILSQEETVANCLWKMTFWGFSWEDIVNRFSHN
jgi:hypothetical protein